MGFGLWCFRCVEFERASGAAAESGSVCESSTLVCSMANLQVNDENVSEENTDRYVLQYLRNRSEKNEVFATKNQGGKRFPAKELFMILIDNEHSVWMRLGNSHQF